MTETFENLKPENYIHYNGNCRTALNKIIPYENIETSISFSECINLCNNNKDCKGITYGYNSTCTLWNPNNNTPYTKVRLNAEDLELDDSYKSLTQGSPSLIADCYIKNPPLDKEKYTTYKGHCLTEDSDLTKNLFYYSDHSSKYTDYNECMNTCDNDPKCTGFSYGDNNGLCYIYNPSIATSTGKTSGTDKHKIVMGDNKNNHICYAKTLWNSATANIEMKQMPLTNDYTNIGAGVCATDFNKNVVNNKITV
jgi:hypothetical protein